MSINCPNCKNRFRFFDLYFLRLKNYQVKCRSCGKIYNINWSADIAGVVLIVLSAMALFALFALFFKILSEYIVFSSTFEVVMIIMLLVFFSIMIIYGHAVYVVWYIKRKYHKEENVTGL
jgi:predicted Zn finger-like uncharacterized protein